mgnify:CR=1 FL=1
MQQETSSFWLPQKALTSISKIYTSILNVAVHISSLLFIGITLAILVPWFKLTYYLAFLWLAVMAIKLFKNKASHKINGIVRCLLRIICIFASASIVLLFANYYFRLIPPLNERFLIIWNILEKTTNEAVFYAMFSIVCSLVYLYLTTAFLNLIHFITEKIKLSSRFKGGIIVALLFLFFIWIPYAVTHGKTLDSLTLSLYPKMGWIFGFSLIALHGNYLIKEFAKKYGLTAIAQ